MESYAELRPAPTNWTRTEMAHLPLYRNVPNVIWLGHYRRNDKDRDPLRCIVSVDLVDYYDPQAGHWLHLSISRAKRTPSWDDLCRVRDEMGFKDRLFIKLLPPTAYWLNVHQHCLHLLHRLDAPGVPQVLWDQDGCDGSNYGKVGVRR